jgi:predicted SAM-dependent methyltransferase
MGFSNDASSYLNNVTNRTVYSFYLSGEGVEIGALAWPLPLPDHVRCRYIDILSTEVLKGIYKDHKKLIIPVDIIDNGETLASLSKDSQDFIISNHFLEHAVNVIKTLKRWYDLLRADGILFLSVPDRRFTADQARQRTSIEHLFDEFERNVTEIPEDHCIDHLVAWNGIPRDRIDSLMIQQCRKYGVHNHCWEDEDILQLFEVLFHQKGVKFQLVDLSLPRGLYNEVILLLRKVPAAREFWTAFARSKYHQQKDIATKVFSLECNESFSL